MKQWDRDKSRLAVDQVIKQAWKAFMLRLAARYPQPKRRGK